MEMEIALPQQPKKTSRRLNWKSMYRARWFYIMMVPGLAYYLIFSYLPMGGLVIAFKEYSLLKGVWDSPWVGFDNFRTIFSSPDFFNILKNTLLISFYRIIFGMFPDVLLALMLNEIRVGWFKRFVQTITYGPHFLSWVIVFGIVYAFLTPGSGLLSQLYKSMGWGSVSLMTDQNFFRPLLIISDLWKSTGFGAIIYLAALGSINSELYEAAVVDGASRWRQIWHITLPGIRDVFLLLLILRIGHILDAGFEQVFIFLNARVNEVGDIIDTWVYRRGLEQLEFSISAATGFFKSIVGFILVLGANHISKRFGGSGIW
ncbi:ABC transporter permease [Paenibacillus eucommiae]|uniref:Aldouronate transport system permease protein n=1 Tax=Paenibacillus eucommiae TaxID=1355755 RepID=A0ABS4JA37_9BACL|nr:ABC transporter permease subunit [Paenibacillus eucommiae]MBP1996675.1 putative aldouronate transport system permease protein [Paenibacillus eucommiae]